MNHLPVNCTQIRQFENVLSPGNAAVAHGAAQESSSSIASFMALLLEATVFRNPRQKEDLVDLVSSLITILNDGVYLAVSRPNGDGFAISSLISAEHRKVSIGAQAGATAIGGLLWPRPLPVPGLGSPAGSRIICRL